jgi:hypothetical protein
MVVFSHLDKESKEPTHFFCFWWAAAKKETSQSDDDVMDSHHTHRQREKINQPCVTQLNFFSFFFYFQRFCRTQQVTSIESELDDENGTSRTRRPSSTVKFQTTRRSIPVRAIFNYPLTVFDYAGRTWWEQMIAKNKNGGVNLNIITKTRAEGGKK